MTPRVLNNPFSLDARAKLLSDRTEAVVAWLRAPENSVEESNAQERIWKLNAAYRDGLPIVRFCLSPFDGKPFDHTLDCFGLDGLWWSAGENLRPIEYLPPHVMAFTGAMTLTDQVEDTTFLCKPGPGAPFVVPGLLNQDGVKAVICPIKIGAHQGWPVIYFRESGKRVRGGFNTWGRDISLFCIDEENSGWNEWVAGPDDYDFNLRPWVESGKLLWVAPEDPSGEPKEGPHGFTWHDATGEHDLQLVQGGRVLLQMPLDPTEWEDEGEEGEEQPSEPEMAVQPDVPEEEAPPQPEAPPPANVPPTQAPPPPIQKAGPKFCRSCGSQLKPGAKFCSSCGAKL